MVKLEDLKKSEMSDSFNKILSEIREITSDEEEQSKLLTARILKDFIEHSQNLKKKNSGFLQPKKPSCSRTKLIHKPRKRSHSETEVVEQEDHKTNTSSALQLPLKKRLYPRAAVVTKEKTKTTSDSDTTPVKELSMEMKNLIESMEGTDIKLVIEKTLSDTDCSKHHDRLTIPKAQAESEFLNDVEKHKMEHRDGHVIQVSVIEPCFEESNMWFREWKMRRTSSYVIRSGWSKACQKPENKLIAGGKVQVWSFRVHGELRFATVRVEETAEPHSSSSCSSSISRLGVEGNYVHAQLIR